jgi:hypothetical protein
MKLKYNFVVRPVGERMVAVAVGADNAKFNGMINLNETGEFIFGLLKNDTTLPEIVSALISEYEISEDEATTAAESFILKLKEGGLLAE